MFVRWRTGTGGGAGVCHGKRTVSESGHELVGDAGACRRPERRRRRSVHVAGQAMHACAVFTAKLHQDSERECTKASRAENGVRYIKRWRACRYAAYLARGPQRPRAPREEGKKVLERRRRSRKGEESRVKRSGGRPACSPPFVASAYIPL
jgi:hypothetical protein